MVAPDEQVMRVQVAVGGREQRVEFPLQEVRKRGGLVQVDEADRILWEEQNSKERPRCPVSSSVRLR